MRPFYDAVLPDRGPYCIVAIRGKKVAQHWAENKEELEDKIEGLKDRDQNVYFALGAFKDTTSRFAANCELMRSFFLDLDCKGGDTYESQDQAIDSLREFCGKVGLPRPVLVNSGNGVHAYWPFNENVKTEDWLPVAKKLKMLCTHHKFVMDPAVPADAARVLRAPGTLNYNADEPKQSELLSQKFRAYSFEDLTRLIEEQCEQAGIYKKLDPILAKAQRGLDENSRAMLNASNFENKFSKIVVRSIKGDGCEHIKQAIEDPAGCDYQLWRACLSIAVRCTDGPSAIHKISEGHPEYSYEETERKANDTAGPYRCESFAEIDPDRCDGCRHRGKITSPIQLGKVFKQSKPVEEVPEPVVEEGEESSTIVAPSKRRIEFPAELLPFVRGENGGIYYVPPPEFDKKKKEKIEFDPVLVYEHDIEILDRVISAKDGECLLIKVHLPLDVTKEFYVPLKCVVSQTELRDIFAARGVAALPKQMERIMEYTTRWANFLQKQKSAAMLRDQLGWSDDMKSFILGDKEYLPRGVVRTLPPSATSRQMAMFQHRKGTMEDWRKAYNRFGMPGFELHAFAALAGFSSVLMPYTGFDGIVINLFGTAGSAKTSSIRAALSVWGSGDMMLADTTLTAARQRAAVLKNIPLGVDEATNKKGLDLSDFIYHFSSGKTKGRMQSSVNAERDHLDNWSSIALTTSNASFYEKILQIKAEMGGEAARLIEFRVTRPTSLTSDAIGAEYFKPLLSNYGHAGPIYIDWLLNNANRTEDLVGEYTQKFQKDFGSESKDRFWSAAVGVMMAGGHISGSLLNLHNLPMERLYNQWLYELEKVAISNEAMQSDPYSILNDFIAEHVNNTLVIERGTSSKRYALPTKTPTSYSGLVIRHEPDTNSTYIIQKPLVRYLAERQLSRKVFEEKLKELGVLKQISVGKRMSAGWEGAVENSVQLAYKFQLDHAKGKESSEAE